MKPTLPLHSPRRFLAYRRRLLCAAALIPILVLVHYSSYWLRFEGQLGERQQHTLATTMLYVVAVKLVVFDRFRIYQGWSRYLTFHDLISVVQASTASSLVLAVANYLLFPGLVVPRSVFLMDWGATIVAVSASRSLSRLIRELGLVFPISSRGSPVLIVGANDSGENLLRGLRASRKLAYRVVGFVSEDDASVGMRIGGIPVLGTLDETCQLAAHHGAAEVFITAGELSGKQVRDLMTRARRQGVGVKVLPSYEQLLDGNLDMRPREVSIEDLLRREPVQLDQHRLHQWIDDRVLLVTGSAGSIGSEICRQLLQFAPRRLVAVDRAENGQFFLQRELADLAHGLQLDFCIGDAADLRRMQAIIARHRPDIIFHAAAYKHVPMMEVNCGEAVKNIVLLTQGLADVAESLGVGSFVMLSTDKAVNPTSVMGACKRVAELYVQALAGCSACRFVTVRFGNVLDSAGSVVPIFRQQISQGGPVTVTHPDMLRYFMMIPEAAQLVIQAGAMGQGGEIFVLDMGEPVRIVDLAADMIRLSGLRVGDDIEIQFIGSRPGEKMFEELHLDGERPVATCHPKIMVAGSSCAGLHGIAMQIRRLSQLTEAPREAIIQQLRRIVPEYRPPASLSEQSRRRAA